MSEEANIQGALPGPVSRDDKVKPGFFAPTRMGAAAGSWDRSATNRVGNGILSAGKSEP
ncbi:MAG: hypothetical protein JWR80_4858 [Bradyrhizobium sp.]|nr:hypothetical protein [Bradyrhizobium sp.]